MPRNDISIDEVIRATGQTTPQKTPVQTMSDNVDPGRPFVDTVSNQLQYHDDKEKRKFKELKFSGTILMCHSIANFDELTRKTSLVFANELLERQTLTNASKIWEMFVHIPEISGILPQPSFKQAKDYKLGKLQGFDKFNYEKRVSRFPKFYCTSMQTPEVLSVWKVNFHDENFLYYGKATSLHTPASKVLSASSELIAENTED